MAILDSRISRIYYWMKILCTVYSYSPLRQNKTFNYKSPLYNIQNNDTRTYGTSIISCNSTNSKCSNHLHDHILSRYFSIIQNKNFCKMRGKGRNYRKPKAINWKKKDITVKRLDNLIKGKHLSKK